MENQSLREELGILADQLASRAVLYAAQERRMIDNVSQQQYNLTSQEKELYELKGFAFEETAPLRENRITLILKSKTQTLAFPTSSVPQANMIQSYRGYMKGMDQAEFSTLLAKNVLKPGTYQVGLLLEEKKGTHRSYIVTGSTIQKTPNYIHYKQAP